MKSFFIALILGIFIGSIATNYFSDPDGYKKLQEAKARLLTNPDETPVAEPQLEPEPELTPPPAMLQVGGKEFEPDKKPEQTPAIEAPAPEKAAPEKQNKAEEIAETLKEKALEIAEQSKPYIETGVDLSIATAIRAQYKLEQRIDSDALSIKVKNQTVILSGSLPDEKTKQLAIEIALFTKGVTSVEETLTIAP